MTSARRYPVGTACRWPTCCWWRPASSREPPAASWLVRRAAPNISAANWAYAAIPDRSPIRLSAALGDPTAQIVAARIGTVGRQRLSVPAEGVVSSSCAPQQVGAYRRDQVRSGQTRVVGDLLQRGQS